MITNEHGRRILGAIEFGVWGIFCMALVIGVPFWVIGHCTSHPTAATVAGICWMFLMLVVATADDTSLVGM